MSGHLRTGNILRKEEIRSSGNGCSGWSDDGPQEPLSPSEMGPQGVPSRTSLMPNPSPLSLFRVSMYGLLPTEEADEEEEEAAVAAAAVFLPPQSTHTCRVTRTYVKCRQHNGASCYRCSPEWTRSRQIQISVKSDKSLAESDRMRSDW